jgi:hypothetical protein
MYVHTASKSGEKVLIKIDFPAINVASRLINFLLLRMFSQLNIPSCKLPTYSTLGVIFLLNDPFKYKCNTFKFIEMNDMNSPAVNDEES